MEWYHQISVLSRCTMTFSSSTPLDGKHLCKRRAEQQQSFTRPDLERPSAARLEQGTAASERINIKNQAVGRHCGPAMPAQRWNNFWTGSLPRTCPSQNRKGGSAPDTSGLFWCLRVTACKERLAASWWERCFVLQQESHLVFGSYRDQECPQTTWMCW